MGEQSRSRLDTVMAILGLTAVELSREVDISNSLISRWQKGTRPLPTKGSAARDLAKVLSKLDTKNDLDELLASYSASDSKEQMLWHYLVGEDMPGTPLTAAVAQVPFSGEYVAQQRVFLGVKGFRKATLLMFDYLALLPPGQELCICAHTGFELWHESLPFALKVLQKLAGLLKRDVQISLISRDTEGFDGSHYLSVFWLSAQLKGIVRTRFYEGEAPHEYFVASIKGHWSARVEYDDTAEDDMITTIYTDPRNIKKDEKHVCEFTELSIPAGQFNFLRHPQGDEHNKRVWREGPLPAQCPMANTPSASARTDVSKVQQPDGSFDAICRVPSFGIMSAEEWSRICKKNAAPALTEYLFCKEAAFVQAPHKIVLCREDVQMGLSMDCQRSVPLSEAIGSKLTVPREILAAELNRLVEAMEKNPDFEVALMPRSAFEKLELELIHWKNSVSLGWLQDGSESLLTIDPLTCKGFANAVELVWERLHKGWKRKKTVRATLRKWLTGKGLDEHEPDSANVRNWHVTPKE